MMKFSKIFAVILIVSTASAQSHMSLSDRAQDAQNAGRNTDERIVIYEKLLREHPEDMGARARMAAAFI